MGASACQKVLPKPFRADTGHSDSKGYIIYRGESPQDGVVFAEKKVQARRPAQAVTLECSWVVPHSTNLLRMFAFHINVELCLALIRATK